MSLETAIQRAIESGSMLYNHKRNCPDDQRDRELRFIYHLAQIAPDGTGVEIGAFAGGTVACWATARMGRGSVVAVDIQLPEIIRANLSRYGIIYLGLSMPSGDAAAYLVEPVAFCFIDGDHSEEGIMTDLELWPLRLMPGGIVAFHDYGSDHEPAIKAAVDEWQEAMNWELIGKVGTLIGFRRPVE